MAWRGWVRHDMARQLTWNYRAYHWMDELPEDERELWVEVRRAAGPRREAPPIPGDWIPFGHVPIELIPEEDPLDVRSTWTGAW
jgi:hypothetical protein